MTSDDQLVREVLAGRRDAFADLIRRHESHVHAVAWAILRDHHAAQDVTQDAFVKAFNEIASLRTPRHFGAWILTIARRAAIDRAKAEKSLRISPDLPEVPTFDAPVEEDAAQILAALTRLPAHEQQVIFLRYFDGLAVADIARLLNCPVGTTTKQLSRAVERLRKLLKELP